MVQKLLPCDAMFHAVQVTGMRVLALYRFAVPYVLNKSSRNKVLTGTVAFVLVCLFVSEPFLHLVTVICSSDLLLSRMVAKLTYDQGEGRRGRETVKIASCYHLI